MENNIMGRCSLCKRAHHSDPCIVCNEIGHAPLDCPDCCSCYIFNYGCIQIGTEHKEKDHKCAFCSGPHKEEEGLACSGSV